MIGRGLLAVLTVSALVAVAPAWADQQPALSHGKAAKSPCPRSRAQAPERKPPAAVRSSSESSPDILSLFSIRRIAPDLLP